MVCHHIKFYHNPVVWGTMGRGFQVFEQPAHAVPHLTPREATPYVHNDLQLFTSRHPGRDWVNNALIDEGDEGLRAEALRYRRMMDEMTEKEAELNVIQDRIAVCHGRCILLSLIFYFECHVTVGYFT